MHMRAYERGNFGATTPNLLDPTQQINHYRNRFVWSLSLMPAVLHATCARSRYVHTTCARLLYTVLLQ